MEVENTVQQHTHIFETSMVVYTVINENPEMDWTEFFMEILGKVKVETQIRGGGINGQRSREHDTS